MSLRNCPKCGKLFVFTTRNMCPDCVKEENDEFALVKEYIREHEKATIDEVSEATGISTSKILKFLKEGRLILNPSNVNITLTCERCDEPILTGKYCQRCTESLSKGFKGVYKDKDKGEKPSGKGKMHTINRFKDR